MIKSFTVQNFKSILDLTLDFSYSEGKAPNGYEEMETLPFLELVKNSKKPVRIVPCMALYGANAAGKSNIIYALYTLKTIIYSGIENLYTPNKLNYKYDTTTFVLEIYIKNILYKYELQYNNTAIINEILSVDNKKIYSINSGILEDKKIATKTYDTKKLKEIYQVECCNADKIQQKTFLHIIAKNYAGLNKFIYDFAVYINLNIQVLGHQDFPVIAGLDMLEKYCGQDKQQAFNNIVNILRKFDFDITKMKFEEELIAENIKDGLNKQNISGELFVRDNKLYTNKIYSYHKDINNNEVEFDFRKEESLGTNILAGLLGPILATLHLGSVLCIDELERSIHPLVLREIIKMFKSKRYNKNNAQLIFTAHNTDILDDDILRVSEICFTSKNIEDGTVIRKASSFKGIRNVNNFRKKYLHGEFAAIPYPYI